MTELSPSSTAGASLWLRTRWRRVVAVLLVGLCLAGIAAVALDTGGDDATATATPTSPASGQDPELEFVTVRRQALTSTLQLRAKTASGQVVLGTPEGMAITLLVDPGAPVVTGQPVARFDAPAHLLAEGQRRVEDARLALRQTQAEAAAPEASSTVAFALEQARLGADRAEADLRALRNSANVLEAPTDGVLVRLESGALAITTGRVVQAELRPLQLLRLRSGALSGTAQIETVTGLRVVPCQEIDVTEGAGKLGAPAEETADAEVAGVVSCSVGEGVETVDGLNAVLEVTVSLGEDVLVVPSSAIGHDDTGAAFIRRRAGGEVEPVAVSLGASDGVLRIVEGLEEGDEIELDSSPAERG